MATEVTTKNDYKKIEKFGLLPTDRDPSSWLRMVARVFSAYKEVSSEKSMVAYINGFFFDSQLCVKESDHLKFVIKKGSCFIDDQFIEVKDDMVFKVPLHDVVPGETYYIVLTYKWSYETNYNVAELKIIHDFDNQFDDEHMLKIGAFDYTNRGELVLLPQDLNDQYVGNFKKLFNLAKDKIIDSLEMVKYQFDSYDVTEHKFHVSCKSGDFVFLDYVEGVFKPARACLKKYDKALGLYLYNGSNDKQYVIYSGIIDFGDPKWRIDDSRRMLTTLETGSPYFLADGCQTTDIIKEAAYNGDEPVDSVNDYRKLNDPGSISTYFFEGTVRTGFALDHDKFFVRIDYSSELTTRNFVELFGDSERAIQIYKDFYKFYTIDAKIHFLIDNTQNNNDILEAINKSIDFLTRKINNTTTLNNTNIDDLNTALNDYNDANNNFNDKQYNFVSSLKNHSTKYFKQNYINSFYNVSELDKIKTIIRNYINQTQNYIDLLDNKTDVWTYLKNSESGTPYYIMKNIFTNIKNGLNNLKTYLNDFYKIINGGKISSGNTLTGIITILNDYISSANTKSDLISFKDKINTHNNFLDTNIDNIHTTISNLHINQKDFNLKHKELNAYTLDEILFNISSITWDTYNYVGIAKSSDGDGSDCKTSIPAEDSVISSHNSNITQKHLPDYYIESNTILNRIVLEVGNFKINILQRYLKYKNNFIHNINADDSYNIENYNDTIEAVKNNKNSAYTNLKNKYIAYEDKFKNYINSSSLLKTLENIKNYLINFLNEFNELNNNSVLELQNLQNELASMHNLLKAELEDDLVTKRLSIYSVSNYQRKVYNYTYLTRRIKIKFNELKHVNDDIEIINNKIDEVNSKIPIDYGLLTRLNDILLQFQALKNTIERELDNMIAEFNRIRTEEFGLDPISNTDENFDPGPYYTPDLDCLEIQE